MIHKVEKLVSIGKFRDYHISGDVSFRKLTMFYADNGSGKTTLTAVFRSLTENKPEIIIKRLSTNQTEPQAAKIIQRDLTDRDTHHTFRPGGWSNPFQDIEIFDIHFINDNIYSGFDFSEDHKKQLHQFVIGAQGVAIKQQIEENKTEKASTRQRICDLESKIIRTVENNLTADTLADFLNLSTEESDDIDEKILTAQVALTTAKANSVIQRLPLLLKLEELEFDFDFSAIISDLGASSEAIQDEALKSMFKDHCIDLAENSIKGPEQWLEAGFRYLINKNPSMDDAPCPFCQSTVSSGLDIIKAYTTQFNEEFNRFVQRLESHLVAVQAFNLDAIIDRLSNLNQTNITRINSFNDHLSGVQAPVYDIKEDTEKIKSEFQSLIETIKHKLLNPLAVVSAETTQEFKSSLEDINHRIAIYNENTETYNNSVNTFRACIQTEQQAQRELDRLMWVKKKCEPGVVDLLTSLAGEKQNLRALDRNYRHLVEQQEATAMSFFSDYKDRINHYLGDVFQTPFRIENVVHVPPQGRATQSKIGYKLTIDGQDISFDINQPNSAKDCLSEGDRSTIALALFLSKLDIDPAKANKVLIFDDPLSSFDSNRRLYTIQIIKDLLPQIKQVVVLSHNEFFLYELSKGVPRGEKRTLRIAQNFLTGSSKIEQLDLETLVEIDYFRHIKELEKFLEDTDLSKKERVLGLMRNVLEAHIRFKFYRQTQSIPENMRTFGRLIDELVAQNVTFRNETDPPSILSDLRIINAISCKPHHGEPVPDYGAIGVNPDILTEGELARFVRKVLELIDNRL